jgi:hypothetical protein
MGRVIVVGECGAVFVELGATPEQDRLQRCTRTDCGDHPVQLDWIRADPGRLAAYNEQLRRYDLGERVGQASWQGSLLL